MGDNKTETIGKAPELGSLPPLTLGDTGVDVTGLQQRLMALGYQITADGQFGPATQNAVITFQQRKNLTADGMVGPETIVGLGFSVGVKQPPVTPAPVPAEPSSATVQGIDVGPFTPDSNWPLLKANGFEFAFIKASEGTSGFNPYFIKDWAASKAAGVLRGAYQFFHPSIDPIAQIDHLLSVLGSDQGDLPIAIDWETHEGTPSFEISRILQALFYLATKIQRKPIVYLSGYYDAGFPLDQLQLLKQYPLWVAHYGAVTPHIPEPWSNYQFWQYQGTVPVTGSGNVDRNVFNGTLTDLRLFAGIKPADPGLVS